MENRPHEDAVFQWLWSPRVPASVPRNGARTWTRGFTEEQDYNKGKRMINKHHLAAVFYCIWSLTRVQETGIRFQGNVCKKCCLRKSIPNLILIFFFSFVLWTMIRRVWPDPWTGSLKWPSSWITTSKCNYSLNACRIFSICILSILTRYNLYTKYESNTRLTSGDTLLVRNTTPLFLWK